MEPTIKSFPMAAFWLSETARWTIVGTSRPQTVAEHSFRVAVLCSSLVTEEDVLRCPPNIRRVLAALFHDAEEVLLGDMPSPAKTAVGFTEDQARAWRDRLIPQAMRKLDFRDDALKAADTAEAQIFIRSHAVEQVNVPFRQPPRHQGIERAAAEAKSWTPATIWAHGQYR